MVFFSSDKDRELGEAHAEIRALRLSERQREKAVEEVCSCCCLESSLLAFSFYIMSFMFFLEL